MSAPSSQGSGGECERLWAETNSWIFSFFSPPFCVIIVTKQNVRGVFAEFDKDKDGSTTAPPSNLQPPYSPTNQCSQHGELKCVFDLLVCVCVCVYVCRYISLSELKEMFRTNGIDYYTDDQIQQMVSSLSINQQTAGSSE